MEGYLLIVIKCILLSWWVTRFEPINWICELIVKKRPGVLTNAISLVLTCSKCFSFWSCLIWSGNLFLAIFASILMLIVEKWIFSQMERIKF